MRRAGFGEWFGYRARGFVLRIGDSFWRFWRLWAILGVGDSTGLLLVWHIETLRKSFSLFGICGFFNNGFDQMSFGFVNLLLEFLDNFDPIRGMNWIPVLDCFQSFTSIP